MAELDQVLAYHQATKHQFNRYARGPDYLDWATQPDPFRRYQGAPLLALDRIPPGREPAYAPSFWPGHLEPRKLDSRSVSQLFYDSLALSSWKRAGDQRWALRVNPSSGNLHPTEGYLICDQVPGLSGVPMVAHYAAREHALEVRAELPAEMWQSLATGLPPGTVLLGLSSIHWREAWKYGERAFRYCQHDVGHAIAAISLAAAGLGWQVRLLDNLGAEQVAKLLGISDPLGAEAEHPDCLLAVYPQGYSLPQLSLPQEALDDIANLGWQGQPNRLSSGHRPWPAIDDVTAATVKPPTSRVYPELPVPLEVPGAKGEFDRLAPLGLRQVVHQRRSAVAMDPGGTIGHDAFFQMLAKTRAGTGQVPFDVLPWSPLVHLVLFVHRVRGLMPGLYILVRESGALEALRSAMRADFLWEAPPSCPEGLSLCLLASGDARAVAKQLSCRQNIASDGCFSLGMIASFQDPLRNFGPWFYRRLFWECGMIGQVLYLEAEAASVRGTGIGCFFDDAVHELLGLEGIRYQSLYHFTVGHPIEDARLTTLPAYADD
jgi:SagB-type dehydrogenase family enzyme